MSSSPASEASNSPRYDGPPPPMEGQELRDAVGGFWKVKRLMVSDNPKGFYLVYLCYGTSRESMGDSMILGPREFAALMRDRDLKPHLHSI